MRFIVFESGAEAHAAQALLDATFCTIFGPNYACKHSEEFSLSKDIDGLSLSVTSLDFMIGIANAEGHFWKLVSDKCWVGSLKTPFKIRSNKTQQIVSVDDDTKIKIQEEFRTKTKLNKTNVKLFNGPYFLYYDNKIVADISIHEPSEFIKNTHIMGDSLARKIWADRHYNHQYLASILVIHASQIDFGAVTSKITKLGPGLSYFREETPAMCKKIIIPAAKMVDLNEARIYPQFAHYHGLLLFPMINNKNSYNFAHDTQLDKRVYTIEKENVKLTSANNRSSNSTIAEKYEVYQDKKGALNWLFCFVCGSPLFERIYIFGRLFKKKSDIGKCSVFGFGACQRCSIGSEFLGSYLYEYIFTTIIDTKLEDVYDFYAQMGLVPEYVINVVKELEAQNKKNGFTYTKSLGVMINNTIISNYSSVLLEYANTDQQLDSYVLL